MLATVGASTLLLLAAILAGVRSAYLLVRGGAAWVAWAIACLVLAALSLLV